MALPLSAGERPRTAAAEPEIFEGAAAKILLVDDRPENLVALEAVLQGPGIELVNARSGMEALRRLLEADFAAILLDVMMPGMDGFETATLIRQRERSRFTPILFLTAINKSDEHVFRGYELGAVDYLFKPIVPQVLRSKVSVFVELSRQRVLLERHAELLGQKNRELELAIEGRRQAEEEVKRLNMHLERRLVDLSEAYRELDAFSYSVSHDLRAPLRRIEGFGQALIERCGSALDEQSASYLDSIRSNAAGMSQLIEALLKLSRLTRAEVSRESVDLSGLARSIAGELLERQPDREVEFDIGLGLDVMADPRMLRIALTNLMENAWKFTRVKPRARIEFGLADVEGGRAFCVRDDGLGFDMERADRLFAPFQRLHAEAEFEGTGIGLATVKRIVQRHGGKIWAESVPGRGAAFYFTLSPAEGANQGAEHG